ncbi:hypothetical protein [uncultured Friedmanniella sp.]|uniref:hypothetical protein n=1 Tax=uncultured Friedmanniella sp. TaxID=335381 RepID=UPI0035CA39FF
MLVPLQTLPGWPTAPDPSTLHVLALLVGGPLVVILLVALIARVHHAARGNVGVPAVANQPVWVNGRRIEPATQDAGSRAAIEAGHQAVTASVGAEPDETSQRDEAETGGAGARW